MLGGHSRNVPTSVHETIKCNMGGRNLVPWKSFIVLCEIRDSQGCENKEQSSLM